MEDSSSYEKVKHEKQRSNIMYNAFWSVCIYIHKLYMCNLCIELSIFFY